ncbi:MAG TPA: right-handed parallel beta-helix repeat-containing protein, partial [Pyrinomonadaceae bacterium]
MKKFSRAFYNPKRWLVFSIIMLATLVVTSLFVGNNVSANHPVLVEGNCDSPVPGTTIVEKGTCGDFDGDGRIGTAEDTDGADRIFGTIQAALGPGTGAAAGTGANMNGTVTIVRSGRFAESLFIGPSGSTSLGNVTLQAAPGVSADINAVLQGDPAGGNTTRQTSGVGIEILSFSADNRIMLRNLTIRNWETGIRLSANVRVSIENCRLESNLNYGIRLFNSTSIHAENLRIASTGFRIGPPAPTVPSP